MFRSKKERTKSFKKEAISLFWFLLAALAFRSFVYELFQIPSSSMVPSLLVGDMPVVEKWTYGYSKYSMLLNPPIIPGRIFKKEVKRGDVVVFKLPSDPWTNYIKRVVGLPGDRVQVINGVVHVNGESATMTLMGEYIYKDENRPGTEYKTLLYTEILPHADDRPHTIIRYDLENRDPKNNTPVYIVPDNHYFMMGDNRDFSQDSRYLDKVGYIHEDFLLGRAVIIFHSMGNRVRFWEFWNWLQNIRYERIFKAIT